MEKYRQTHRSYKTIRSLIFSMHHIPVLLNEVIQYLEPENGDIFVDATFGFGGHSREIASQLGPNGRIIGIEKDFAVYDIDCADKTLSDHRLTLVRDDFKNIDLILEKEGVSKVNKILFDLGVSSYHFDESEKGFSFSGDQPLDMRLDTQSGVTAQDLINGLTEKELADLFYNLADERASRQIAKRIILERKKEKIASTARLVEIVSKAKTGGRINPATKVFQALRMAVNDELGVIKEALPKAINLLEKGGRLAVISFHSGEDRIVKNIFKDFAKINEVKILTKKPVSASITEIRQNPRSRSAKLRVVERNT